MEYCEYVLSTIKGNMVKGFFSSENVFSMSEFRKYLNTAISLYKRGYGVKENSFQSEKMLIKTLDRFLDADVIFMKAKCDDLLGSLYRNTKQQFKEVKENYKNTKELSYDAMFEVVSNLAILCSNTLANFKDSECEKGIIYCKTIDVEVDGICRMIGDSIKILERSEKAKRYEEKYDKKYGKLPKPLATVAQSVSVSILSVIPLVGPLAASGMGVKSLWDLLQWDKADKDNGCFMYLWCVLAATYTKNEELKEMINYGW